MSHTKQTAKWSADGPEAEALLALARSAPPPLPEKPEASERFLVAYREHTADQSRRNGRRIAIGRWRYAIAASLAIAACAGVFVLGLRLRDGNEDALSYRVKSGEIGARFIRTSKEPVELDFSDGTVVTVDGATSARVGETTRRGAHFLLESGRMEFNVVPHSDRGNWVVEAGPFQVHVTGTIFTVEWLSSDGQLRVDVTRGHVVVEGAGQRRELGPGDSFHHREVGRTAAEPAVANGTAEDNPSIAPLEPEVDAGANIRLLAPLGSAHVKALSWAALVAAGEFDKVLAAATQRGLQGCLDECAQADLFALADSARLSGKSQLAERALLAQRARFAGSADGKRAAFLLGRLAEERGDARALAWYDTYLAESPSGRFAGDALGRKMMLLSKSDPIGAQLLARQYGARFPAGPYASHAKSLLESSR